MRMHVKSPTRLSEGSYTEFRRQFHVEVLKGGMNRLLLRALPVAADPTRVEVFFQYVQHLEMPMRFDGLAVRDVTHDELGRPEYVNLHRKFPECRVYRLESQGATVGRVMAAACLFGEDSAAAGAESMFPMM